MKIGKRILSLLFAFVFVISIFAMDYKFGGNVISINASASTLSEDQYAAKLSSQKGAHPNGQKWKGIYVGNNGKYYAYTCMGWVAQCCHDIFGSTWYSDGYASYDTWTKSTTLGTVYAGDHIRIKGDSHSIFVTKVDGSTIYYTEAIDPSGNNSTSNSYVYWDKTISYSSLSSIFTYKHHLNGNTLNGLGNHTHNYNIEYSYWAEHPHYKMYKCSCGAEWTDMNDPMYLPTCSTCQSDGWRSRTPDCQFEFNEGDSVTISWKRVVGSTSYHLVLWKYPELMKKLVTPEETIYDTSSNSITFDDLEPGAYLYELTTVSSKTSDDMDNVIDGTLYSNSLTYNYYCTVPDSTFPDEDYKFNCDFVIKSNHACVYDQKDTCSKYLKSKATCTSPAKYYYSCECGEKGTKTFTKGSDLGHNFVDGTCTRCGENIKTIRTYGDDRYETSIQTANALKKALGVSKFETIIVAYGRNYADALAGSYLATIKNAPILLVNTDKNSSDRTSMSLVRDYIDANLAKNGTVYILGGTAVISDSYMNSLMASDRTVKRLAGENRYETNIEILMEAGFDGMKLLVVDAYSYADALSVSSIGKPILLVNKSSGKLNTSQKAYLNNVKEKIRFVYIVGGTAAVPNSIQKELGAIKDGVITVRLDGDNRYDTSISVAQCFSSTSKAIVLVYGNNFPDGLCGGPLAHVLGDDRAPIILTHPSKTNSKYAKNYIKEHSDIEKVVVLGGQGSKENPQLTDSLIKSIVPVKIVENKY